MAAIKLSLITRGQFHKSLCSWNLTSVGKVADKSVKRAVTALLLGCFCRFFLFFGFSINASKVKGEGLPFLWLKYLKDHDGNLGEKNSTFFSLYNLVLYYLTIIKFKKLNKFNNYILILYKFELNRNLSRQYKYIQH